MEKPFGFALIEHLRRAGTNRIASKRGTHQPSALTTTRCGKWPLPRLCYALQISQADNFRPHCGVNIMNIEYVIQYACQKISNYTHATTNSVFPPSVYPLYWPFAYFPPCNLTFLTFDHPTESNTRLIQSIISAFWGSPPSELMCLFRPLVPTDFGIESERHPTGR